MRISKLRPQSGFTLLEMMMVALILVLLFIITSMSWRQQMEKARDARKKDHLHKLSLAFEQYFADYNHYPPADILDTCGGGQLKPYLDSVPCDPTTGRPYCYIEDPENPGNGQNYRILTPLKAAKDPVIAQNNCHTDSYCGWEAECADPTYNIFGFNYGVYSKNITLANTTVSQPHFYCQSPGNCTSYDPLVRSCSPSYTNALCNPGACAGITSTCTDL
jgi:general secretion pathway protein G